MVGYLGIVLEQDRDFVPPGWRVLHRNALQLPVTRDLDVLSDPQQAHLGQTYVLTVLLVPNVIIHVVRRVRGLRVMLRLELGETELPGVLEVILIGLGQILPGVRECSAIHFFKVRVILPGFLK